jgi:hypothetical protein
MLVFFAGSFCREVLPDILNGQQPFANLAVDMQEETNKAKARQYRLRTAFSKFRFMCVVNADIDTFKTALGRSRTAFCVQGRAFRRLQWHMIEMRSQATDY